MNSAYPRQCLHYFSWTHSISYQETIRCQRTGFEKNEISSQKRDKERRPTNSHPRRNTRKLRHYAASRPRIRFREFNVFRGSPFGFPPNPTGNALEDITLLGFVGFVRFVVTPPIILASLAIGGDDEGVQRSLKGQTPPCSVVRQPQTPDAPPSQTTAYIADRVQWPFPG